MSPTLIQSVESTPGGVYVTESFSSNTTPGNTLVAACCDWGSNSGTFFTAPTGWTMTTNGSDYGTLFNQVNAGFLFETSIAGGSENYTFTSSSSYMWVGLAEFSSLALTGVDWTVPYQQLADSGGSYTMTGNTPAQSGEFVLAGIFTASGNAIVNTTPSGWNLLAEFPNGTTTGNTRGAVYWQIAGSSAPVCNFSWTQDDSMTFLMTAFTFPATNNATTWLLT